MNRYIVAYINNFDNVLSQTLVEADSEYEAAIQYLDQFQDIEFEEGELRHSKRFTELEVLQETMFNMDANISVYKIAG